MLKVNFYKSAKDELFKFAVIVSNIMANGYFASTRSAIHMNVPVGIEKNEPIFETAKRELWEETGAIKYHLEPVCVYSVERDGKETFGMLYFADIVEFEELPSLEIEKLCCLISCQKNGHIRLFSLYYWSK